MADNEVFVVRGGQPLRGVVRVQGAKNSALKLMAASLLAEGEVVLTNVPAIADVEVMGDVLRGLGGNVDLDLDAGVCSISYADEPAWHPPRDAVTRIRASISTLGPLVGRCKKARLAFPGGDRIGVRRIDLHIRGLQAMGAEVTEENDEVEVVADYLHGAHITLDFPSVGATENLIMAATRADGLTIIDNAAREPEIQDLCAMLRAMGADISGAGSTTIEVYGVERLEPITWRTCPDRIEAGTFAVAAAVTGGDVVLEDVRPADLYLFLLKLRETGVIVEEGADTIRVQGVERLRPINLVTLPYPGFPTDLQTQAMVLLSQADGTSMVTENVFESRFAFVEQLHRMGADIVVDGHHAVIRGPRALRGAALEALDVRAGASGVLAGLVAEGETVVSDVHHIDRGYTDLEGRLQALGADVSRTTV